MNIDRQILHRHSAFALLLLGLSISGPASAQFTMTINSLADDGLQVPDDIICSTAASECTFRAAIEAANNRSDIVIIEFSPHLETDAMGRSILFPQSSLPPISSRVVIQGQTHPNFNPSDNFPRFLISGADIEGNGSGLRLGNGSQNSQIRHIAIYDFPANGFFLSATSEVTLEHNFLGLRPVFIGPIAGSEVVGNGESGILMTGSSNNTIESNWIGGNGADGIVLFNASADNLVIRNRIGQRPASGGIGVDVAGNQGSGIRVAAGSGPDNLIGQCSGFPQQTCRGNIITANEGFGIHLLADGQHVQANLVGTTPEAPENPDYGNNDHGIRVESSNNVIIGGLQFRQPIRHNAVAGISATSGSNVITGNLILDNGSYGVLVQDGGQEIQNNIIGGHGSGIFFLHTPDATPAGLLRILNNRIGVSATGDPIPNNWGIAGLQGGFTRIGLPGQGNTIAFNNIGGIAFSEAETSWVQGNWIGILQDGTPAGNDGPGIYVTVHSDNASGGVKRIGYLAQDTIPEDPIDGPDAQGNIIAYNTDGVLINSSVSNFTLNNNPIRGNRFIANSGQAINLGPDGDTVDPGGAMEGPNRLQNFPQFNPVETFFNDQTGEVEFNYLVATTTAHASYPLSVDFYIADGSSSQGWVYLYTDSYTSSFAAQPKSGSFTLPPGVNPAGAWLVATATDADGNTSQFSAPVPLAEIPDELFQDRFED